MNLDREKTVQYFNEKYFIHYYRMIKVRKSTKYVNSLTKRLTNAALKKENSVAEILRQNFEEFLSKESARGLYYPLGFYKNSMKFVLTHEKYEPEVHGDNLYGFPSQVDSVSDDSDYGVINKDEKRHLIFL